MQARRITTQVGSLPYDNIDQAVAYSLQHDIPFLPELPKLGDSMMDYIKNPGKMSCLDVFKDVVGGLEIVKVQCIGPATLVSSGKYEPDEAVERAYNHISALLNGLEAENILLFLDEPSLGYTGINFENLWEPLFASFDVIPGVHTCGDMDWDKLFESSLIDIISFDASKYNLTKFPKYRNTKRIAWGITKPEDARDFQKGDLLTMPCGLGTYDLGETPTICDDALELLTTTAEKYARRVA